MVATTADTAAKKVRKQEEVVEANDDEINTPVAKKAKVDPAAQQRCHTLYIKNLNDKLNKKTMIEQLYILFSSYGEVIDVRVMKSSKMRGQAHVAFKSVTDANIAMRSLQNDVIFGKNMVIEWAKENSKIITQLS